MCILQVNNSRGTNKGYQSKQEVDCMTKLKLPTAKEDKNRGKKKDKALGKTRAHRQASLAGITACPDLMLSRLIKLTAENLVKKLANKTLESPC